MSDQHTIVITEDVIVRYLTGEAGADEAAALHDWLEQADNKLHFEKLKSTWERAYPSQRPQLPEKKRAWKNLQQKMHEADQRNKKPIGFTQPVGFFFKVAATILLVAVVGIFTYTRLHPKTPFLQSAATDNSLREVILPDHSRAVLGHYSKLSYEKNFTGERREVKLSGEAFFKVTHDRSKPFIVHTAMADIRVVGTAFNVAVKNNAVEVSVAEGKVLVYTAEDSIYLEPGKAVTVNSRTSSLRKNELANSNTWGYATRKFEFKNTSLNEVFDCIEKSYPYSIKVQNDAIKNCKLTATFDDASAEYIVTLIAETLDLTLTKKDHVFFLEGKGCN